MEGSESGVGVAARLRAARLAQAFVITAVIAAVAWPYFLHFVGFQPARAFDQAVYPRPVSGYPFRETPNADGTHGIDFSQVWIAARRLTSGDKVYERVDWRKWRRRWSSTYHPAVHWLYIPVSWLPLRDGLIVHNLFSMGLFLLCAALALRRAGCLRALPGLTAAYAAAMLLTPTGLLHLERGQFDTYIAAALVCIVALFSYGGPGRIGWAIGAGLLSTLKVSAWPLVGFYWMLGVGLRGLRVPVVWLVPVTILALNLIFFSGVQAWIPAFLYVAEDHVVGGSSFKRIVPLWLAIALPFIATLSMAVACFVSLRMRGLLGDSAAQEQLLGRIFFPFALALALQTICGTPVTHDYRLVGLFGLLPALSVWCARGETISDELRYAVAFGYALVLVVAMRIIPFTSLSNDGLVTWLLVSSLVSLCVAIYLVFGSTRSSSRWSLLPKRLATLTRSG